MSEAKYTPAPWNLPWIYGGIRHLNRNVDFDAFVNPDDLPDSDNIPQKEDARLIAAAPILLAALEELTEAAAESWPNRACVQTARAALAAAQPAERTV